MSACRTALFIALALGTFRAHCEEVVRVATLNLWHSRTSLQERTAAATALLQNLQPHVIGLQEVSGSIWRRNRARLLADALNHDYVYHPSDGLRLVFQEGLAVLARSPIHDSGRVRLPHSHPWPFEARHVQFAEVRLASGQPFILFNTHLTHRDQNDVGRLEQALDVIEFAAAQALARDIPAILVGDLNSSPSDLAVQALLGRLMNGPALFQDAWVSAGEGPGSTLSPTNPYLEPHSPASRVDYVLVMQGTSLTPRPLQAWRFGDPSNACSDHYGIVVDAKLVPAQKPVAPNVSARQSPRSHSLKARSAAVQADVQALRQSIALVRADERHRRGRLNSEELAKRLSEAMEARLRPAPSRKPGSDS